MVSVVAHSCRQPEVLERGAGAGARERSHGNGVRAEIGIGRVTGGVVYVVVGIVRVLVVPVKHRVYDNTMTCSTVARHTKRVISDKVSGTVRIAGVRAV